MNMRMFFNIGILLTTIADSNAFAENRLGKAPPSIQEVKQAVQCVYDAQCIKTTGALAIYDILKRALDAKSLQLSEDERKTIVEAQMNPALTIAGLKELGLSPGDPYASVPTNPN